MSIEVNEDLDVIEIIETMSFEHHVLPVIHQIREELQDWYDTESEDPSEVDNPCLAEDLESCKSFLDDTVDDNWNKRWKTVCLCEIVNEYERECNYHVYEPSIFDEEIIRKGVENFIEEEWGFDPRF
jgi:hypothetical protein